ncbi:MAG: CoA transferase [Ilumatobacteraceae bacterium]
MRQLPPLIDGDTTQEAGSGFLNHNVEKLGITLNLRTERGRELLAELVRISDVVTENFSAGVMERLGFGYERLRELRPDVVYASNCGFGHEGPYRDFKSWGPITQAVCGLTFSSGLPDREPAGWGYSYMDHTGAYGMAIAILAALYHRAKTGEGQWIDISCTETGAALNGPGLLDFTVNGRPFRRPGQPDSNRNQFPLMAPHGIYRTCEPDRWVAVACRDDEDWSRLRPLLADTAPLDRFADLDALDSMVEAFTSTRTRDQVVAALTPLGVPVAGVASPSERADEDPVAAAWGLWPTAHHTKHGDRRVDGLPVHLSETDWSIRRAGPLLGEHNEFVFGEVLGLSSNEIGVLADAGVI